MESAVRGRLFEWGVWRAPVLIDGLPAIWAVDASGVVRKVRKIWPGDDEDALADRLFAWLVENHPQRKLELVREVSPTPPLPPIPVTDPRHPLARRAYLDHIIAEGRRKLNRYQPRRRDI